MIGKVPQGLVVAITVLLGLAFQPIGLAAESTAQVAAAPPSGFTMETVASGLDLATSFAFAPDGRIFIAEKSGVVRVWKNGSILPGPLINISANVNNYGDRGLIGMALDPNFASNGYIYLLYPYEATASDDSGTKTGRLSRFTVVGDTASTGTQKVILGTNVGSACSQFPVGSDCIPEEWYGHGVGDIDFGGDGTMFLTIGDASSWNVVTDDALRAQNLDSLAGKILRIDPSTGQGLANNPYWTGDPNAARSKVWAYGLRNAFRFSVRPGSGSPGTVYAGDVGWNTTEEVDAVPKGANLGWPCYEGNAVQSGYQPKPICQALYAAVAQDPSKWTRPIVAYDHNGTGASVTGGPFPTNTTYPAPYQGAYFFGDYARNQIQYVTVDSNNVVTSGPTPFDQGADSPVDIQFGPNGNLYYLSIATGELRQYVYGGSPPPPPPPPPSTSYLSDLPWTSATNGWGPVERDMSDGGQAAGDGTTITLGGVTYAKGLGTHALADVRYPLSGCTNFQSDVGIDDSVGVNGSVNFLVYLDGVLAYDSGVMTGSTATKNINLDLTAKSQLGLVVTNGGDNINYDHADWANARITCGSGSNQPPVPTITSPTSSTTFAVGDVINFQGSAVDPGNGNLPPSALSWQINIQHCIGASCHPHYFMTVPGSGGSFTVEDHGDMFHFDVTLTATDSTGLTASTTVSIQPRTLNLTLATNPTGLQVVVGGTAGTAPFTTTQVDGAVVTITAPSPQNGLTFSSWSDGGAQQHNVALGTTDVTRTATFAAPPTPTVTSVTPTEGATAVAASTNVAAAFSTDIDQSTLTSSTVTLQQQGTPVATQLSYNAGTRTVTLDPIADLQAGATYTATVVGGASGVKSTSGNPLAASKTWTFTIAAAQATTTYLSDMTWTLATNGLGPVERDMSNGGKPSGDGKTITLNQVTYAKGLGVHSASDVRFAIDGKCTSFETDVGVDDEVGNKGSVVFKVILDGTKVYDSGKMTGSTTTKSMTLDLTGKQELRLQVAVSSNGNSNDHADWAGARVTCSP